MAETDETDTVPEPLTNEQKTSSFEGALLNQEETNELQLAQILPESSASPCFSTAGQDDVDVSDLLQPEAHAPQEMVAVAPSEQQAMATSTIAQMDSCGVEIFASDDEAGVAAAEVATKTPATGHVVSDNISPGAERLELEQTQDHDTAAPTDSKQQCDTAGETPNEPGEVATEDAKEQCDANGEDHSELKSSLDINSGIGCGNDPPKQLPKQKQETTEPTRDDISPSKNEAEQEAAHLDSVGSEMPQNSTEASIENTNDKNRPLSTEAQQQQQSPDAIEGGSNTAKQPESGVDVAGFAQPESRGLEPRKRRGRPRLSDHEKESRQKRAKTLEFARNNDLSIAHVLPQSTIQELQQLQPNLLQKIATIGRGKNDPSKDQGATSTSEKSETHSVTTHVTPRNGDILFGRQVTISDDHPGSVKFRRIVQLLKGLFSACSKVEKGQICQAIVAAILECNARFLERDASDGNWSVVSKQIAVEKTMQSFRQKGPQQIDASANGCQAGQRANAQGAHKPAFAQIPFSMNSQGRPAGQLGGTGPFLPGAMPGNFNPAMALGAMNNFRGPVGMQGGNLMTQSNMIQQRTPFVAVGQALRQNMPVMGGMQIPGNQVPVQMNAQAMGQALNGASMPMQQLPGVPLNLAMAQQMQAQIASAGKKSVRANGAGAAGKKRNGKQNSMNGGTTTSQQKPMTPFWPEQVIQQLRQVCPVVLQKIMEICDTGPGTGLEKVGEITSVPEVSKQELPMKDIEKPRDSDVLSGRGGVTNHHPGNEMYRFVIKLLKAPYNSCRSHQAKRKISRSIVAAVRHQNGRFLALDSSTNTWNDIGDDRAIEKTSQCLRELAKQETPIAASANASAENGKTSSIANMGPFMRPGNVHPLAAFNINPFNLMANAQGMMRGPGQSVLQQNPQTNNRQGRNVLLNTALSQPGLIEKVVEICGAQLASGLDLTHCVDSTKPVGANPVLPMEDIKKPEEKDILFGYDHNGGYVGNRKFYLLLDSNKHIFGSASMAGKGMISRSIVVALRENQIRFLKRDVDKGNWSDVGDKIAIEKTRELFQAFQDGKLNLQGACWV